MASTSPWNVLKAYYEQFQRDFSLFLKCRAEEVVEGGRMVLTFLGRRSDDPSTKSKRESRIPFVKPEFETKHNF